MTSSQSKVVIGYASIWTPIEFSKIPGNSLTHIVYSFLNIKSDGTLIFGDDGCDKCCATNFLNQLLQVKYKYKHLKIHISVGGASWASSFLPVLSDGSKREILVNAINDLLTTYHLDGIDIDWEYPGTNQGSYFVQFAKELRQKLHSSIEITCAIPSSPTTLRNYNIADSNPYFNWFNIMAYDASIGSGYITHQAPLFRNPSNPTEDASGDTAVKALLNYGVPSNKIVLGVPLYGYLYKATTNDNSNHGLFQSISCTQNCETTVNNKDISSSSPNTRYFDPIAQAPWLYNVNTGAFISFEDLDSVQYKINYVNNQALKGVMFWELGQDNLGSTSVINSVFKNLNNISLEDMTYTYTPLPMPVCPVDATNGYAIGLGVGFALAALLTISVFAYQFHTKRKRQQPPMDISLKNIEVDTDGQISTKNAEDTSSKSNKSNPNASAGKLPTLASGST